MVAPSDRHVTLTELLGGALLIGTIATIDTELIAWPREVVLGHVAISAVLTALAFWFALKNSEASQSKRMGGLFILTVLISAVVGSAAQVIYTENVRASFSGIPVVTLTRPDRSKYKGNWDELERPVREFMLSLAPDLTRNGFRADRRSAIPVYQLILRNGSTLTIEHFALWDRKETEVEATAYVVVNYDSVGWTSEHQPAKQEAFKWVTKLEQAWKDYFEKFPDADLKAEYARHKNYSRPSSRPIIPK